MGNEKNNILLNNAGGEYKKTCLFKCNFQSIMHVRMNYIRWLSSGRLLFGDFMKRFWNKISF